MEKQIIEKVYGYDVKVWSVEVVDGAKLCRVQTLCDGRFYTVQISGDSVVVID